MVTRSVLGVSMIGIVKETDTALTSIVLREKTDTETDTETDSETDTVMGSPLA